MYILLSRVESSRVESCLCLQLTTENSHRKTAILNMASSRVSMKLLIDSHNKRVLFAEANKETVDFLFNILTLPVAAVIRLLKEQGMVGSLANLYESVDKLNESYIQPNQTKETLLQPSPPFGNSSVPLLLMNDAKTVRNFYKCGRSQFGCSSNNVSDDPRAICPQCSQNMTKAVTYVAPPGKQASTEGGFVKGVVTYMIMDNLVVNPLSTISSITLLNQFNIKELGTLQEKEVTLGMDEAVKLLKASLQSEKVLTHVFLDLRNHKADQMNAEDSMAEDSVQSSAPSIPIFGQPTISPSPLGFMFGSTPPSLSNPFQFSGQQNQTAPRNPSLFDTGGGFSLGSGGADKSSRKFVKVNRNKNRKK